MPDVKIVSIDGKRLHQEWYETVHNLKVPISFQDFKYKLWPDELKYRARLWRMRRHGQ